MPAPMTFLDTTVSTSPPQGHLEPVPLTLGTSWQTNDVRLMFIKAQAPDAGASWFIGMHPDPPTGFTPAYSYDPGYETEGIYYNRLTTSSASTNLTWLKPSSWDHFVMVTTTARGVAPTVAPTGSRGTVSYFFGDATATLSSLTIPSAGVAVACVGTVADPDGDWPSWPVAMGVPTGWAYVGSTNKSGSSFAPYDSTPNVLVIAKRFTTSGSTGTVSIPVGKGGPAFIAMWAFLAAAGDVSISVGAA